MYHRFKARRMQDAIGCPQCAPRCDVCGHDLMAQSAPREKRVTGPYETREQLVMAINELHNAGYAGGWIAEKLGISGSTVSRIINGDKRQNG
jgi:AraC-like DNA-binding protein